jgi:hypothetical protein
VSYDIERKVDNVTEIASIIKHNFFEKFTKLDQLSSLKLNSFINVLGVILSIDPNLKQIDSKSSPGTPLKLINFKLGDTSSNEVNIAMWGAEAENFNFKPGMVLKLEKVKITNFGGYTLSVLRHSMVENITDLEISSSLRKYWSTHPMKLRIIDETISDS